MITAALFFVYFCLFCWLLPRIPFIANSGIQRNHLMALFAFRLAVGAIYAWLGTTQSGYGKLVDTWGFHHTSLKETYHLLHEPALFWGELVYHSSPDHAGLGNLFASSNSFWNDLKDNVVLKFLGLINPLTGGNYFINLIWYNAFVFPGIIAIYRSFKLVCVDASTKWLIGITFFIPSFVFWTSGIHKDGILAAGLGFLTWGLIKAFYGQKWNYREWLLYSFSAILVFAVRNYIALGFAVAVVGLWLFKKYRTQRLPVVFLLFCFLGLILFFGLPNVFPSLNFPAYVRFKQLDFFTLVGGTEITLPQLTDNYASYLTVLPFALKNVLFQPIPGTTHFWQWWMASIEWILLWGVFLYQFFKTAKHPKSIWFYFFFFWCCTTLLAIGYTVNIMGAIVRYRSVLLPFWLGLPLLKDTNNKKL